LSNNKKKKDYLSERLVLEFGQTHLDHDC